MQLNVVCHISHLEGILGIFRSLLHSGGTERGGEEGTKYISVQGFIVSVANETTH